MKKVLFITQKRWDAIGIVDNNQRRELEKREHPFVFFEIKEKWGSQSQIMWNYLYNIILIFWKSLTYNTIFFSWENPYGIFIKLFTPRKKVTMMIHHVERYWWKTIIGKLIFKMIDHFIAISQFTRDQLIKCRVMPEKITVNYNGISKNFYPEKIENFKSFKYFLYVGTEIPRKNVTTLFNVFKKLKREYSDLKLVKIWKPGTEEAKKETDQLIKKLWLSDAVVFYRNFISDDELRKRYSNALCYVSLATLEGFGLTIPEAMACACPVLASKIWSFEEICQDETILVDPFDMKTIEDKLKYYLEDQDFRLLKAEEWLIKAKRFDWGKNVENLILFFNKW